jgi:hypothetical protein
MNHQRGCPECGGPLAPGCECISCFERRERDFKRESEMRRAIRQAEREVVRETVRAKRYGRHPRTRIKGS